MGRPPKRAIVSVEPFTLPRGAKRERLTLSCGHSVDRAPRQLNKRGAVVCLKCCGIGIEGETE